MRVIYQDKGFDLIVDFLEESSPQGVFFLMHNLSEQIKDTFLAQLSQGKFSLMFDEECVGILSSPDTSEANFEMKPSQRLLGYV